MVVAPAERMCPLIDFGYLRMDNSSMNRPSLMLKSPFLNLLLNSSLYWYP